MPWLLACAPKCEPDELSGNGTCTPYTDGTPSDRDVWTPSPGTSWQIQYSGTLDTSLDVDVYDVDLFDTSNADLAALPTTICYFSAGSWEDWREDADSFPAASKGEPLDGWPGEWWLDIRDAGVRTALTGRLDRAVERGCTAVDPDNVNGWENETGFPLTRADQLDFNRFLAEEAHARGLSIGLKNDQLQAEALAPWFDWALNEECAAYDECDGYAIFTDADKAVFHVEYVDEWSDAEALAEQVCGVGPRLDTLIKTWDLGAERLACPVDSAR
jgi:hypothetical protein